MKKIFFTVMLLVVVLSGTLYSSHQIVEIYVCGEFQEMAELQAKATVNRKELYRVSYCNCQGVTSDMKSEVKDGSCKNEKSRVYSCICVGKDSY